MHAMPVITRALASAGAAALVLMLLLMLEVVPERRRERVFFANHFPIESRNRKNSNGLAMLDTGRLWLLREIEADIDGWERWRHARRVCVDVCFLCVRA